MPQEGARRRRLWRILIVILILFTLLTVPYNPISGYRPAEHTKVSEIAPSNTSIYRDEDHDLLPDDVEVTIGVDPTEVDTDNDLFPDGPEYRYWSQRSARGSDYRMTPDGDIDSDRHINLDDPDSDNDGVLDGYEVEAGLDPANPDSNGDGLPDRADAILFFRGNFYDGDRDGMPDAWEACEGVTDARLDPDGDGFTNREEYWDGTAPRIPNRADGRYTVAINDSDSDGFPDREQVCRGMTDDLGNLQADVDRDNLTNGEEVRLGTNPFLEDTDDDQLLDADETLDPLHPSPLSKDTDKDRIPDASDIPNNTLKLTYDPRLPDTNENGIADGEEDPDRDGLRTYIELNADDGFVTRPFDPDTDGDGLRDGAEDRNRNGRRDGNDPTVGASDWNGGKGPGETEAADRDTDNGGQPDGEEVGGIAGVRHDPLNPNDDPVPTAPPPPPPVPWWEWLSHLFPKITWPKITWPTIGPWTLDPAFFTSLGGILFLAVIAVLIIAILLVIGKYRSRKRRRAELDEIISVLEAGEKRLEEIDLPEDIRLAIYKVYLALQATLKRFGIIREPTRTVREFEIVVRKELPVKEDHLDDLTGVFEEARYSDHELALSHREKAIHSFRAIRRDLVDFQETEVGQARLDKFEQPGTMQRLSRIFLGE